MAADLHLNYLLQQRKEKGNFRELKLLSGQVVDFSSNDYLGYSYSGKLDAITGAILSRQKNNYSGSGGSRLLSGNSSTAVLLEKKIAAFHSAESALLFNSGFDANLGFYSAVPQKNDLILYDECIHASIIDGIRLSFADAIKFKHNNIADLIKKFSLKTKKYNNVFVAVESVYSMDGDFSPLKDLAKLCEEMNWNLCVDEAHSTGVFGVQGRGCCNELGIEEKCFVRMYTYGKAFGCHGAAVVGSSVLTQYLINFSRPFIYSTALPPHSLFSIDGAYQLACTDDERLALFEVISHAQEIFSGLDGYQLSNSAIHILRVQGNRQVSNMVQFLQESGFDVRAVKSPTVSPGKECIRICLHAFNTREELIALKDAIGKWMIQ